MTPHKTVQIIRDKRDLIHKNVHRRRNDIKRYVSIQKMIFKSHDLRTDIKFQTTFNAFYRLRINFERRTIFYSIMERERQNLYKTALFEDLLKEIAERSGRIEISFVSKMMATLNEDIAPYDQLVCNHLGLKPSYSSSKEIRLARGVENFNAIQSHLNSVLEILQIHIELNAWNTAFPEFSHIRDIKKLDLMLWLMR